MRSAVEKLQKAAAELRRCAEVLPGLEQDGLFWKASFIEFFLLQKVAQGRILVLPCLSNQKSISVFLSNGPGSVFPLFPILLEKTDISFRISPHLFLPFVEKPVVPKIPTQAANPDAMNP